VAVCNENGEASNGESSLPCVAESRESVMFEKLFINNMWRMKIY